MKIQIYGRSNCRFCDDAKALLDEKGIEYDYIDLVSMLLDHRREILRDSGMSTVPIVKVDEIYIGGYTQLEKYLAGLQPAAGHSP